MATAEHSMWVTKRYPTLQNQVGFVMVPADLREALIADGGAQDTFDFRSEINPAPAMTTATFTPAALASDAAVGSTAGTFAATGGTAPYAFVLVVNPGAQFVVDGATLKTAITPLTVGANAIGAVARDDAGRNKPISGTVTVTAPAPPAALSTQSAPKKTVARK